MSTFRQVQKGVIEVLEAPTLAACGSVIHAFGTRLGGVSDGAFSGLNVSTREGDSPELVGRNWRRIAGAFGIRLSQFRLMHQGHGDGICVIDGTEPTAPCSASSMPVELEGRFDALVTNLPGVALAVKTADCVPLLMADPRRGVIAAVHAGWRGSAKNIAGKVASLLVESFSSRREDILVALGPSIGPCCYEVDAPVYGAFGGGPGISSFFHPRPGKDRWMLDLAGVNRQQFEERGIPPENIVSSGRCTSCLQGTFFSHRREGPRAGRQVNFIMMPAKG